MWVYFFHKDLLELLCLRCGRDHIEISTQKEVLKDIVDYINEFEKWKI